MLRIHVLQDNRLDSSPMCLEQFSTTTGSLEDIRPALVLALGNMSLYLVQNWYNIDDLIT